ncbi:MAG: helix-turn-helix transcriptional regulator [Candidatus Dormibacteria bacterium]
MAREDGYGAGDKFARVVALLQRLATTRRGLTTAEIADELAITARSIQRYIKQLRDQAGLDIVEVDGRLRLGEGSRLPPMQFDAHQATALLIAARLLQQMRPGRDPAVIGAVGHLAGTRDRRTRPAVGLAPGRSAGGTPRWTCRHDHHRGQRS